MKRKGYVLKVSGPRTSHPVLRMDEASRASILIQALDLVIVEKNLQLFMV